MQLSTTTLWIVPVSKVTPGAAEYGLAREMPSLLPEGHSIAIAARVSRVSGISTAARMRFAFRRAAIACGRRLRMTLWNVGVTGPHQQLNLIP